MLFVPPHLTLRQLLNDILEQLKFMVKKSDSRANSMDSMQKEMREVKEECQSINVEINFLEKRVGLNEETLEEVQQNLKNNTTSCSGLENRIAKLEMMAENEVAKDDEKEKEW